jgi:transposase
MQFINNAMLIKKFIYSIIEYSFAFSLQTVKDFLTPAEIETLKLLHKRADRKQRDKIKAILSLNRGYSYAEIAEILLIDQSTLWRWFESYQTGGVKGLTSDHYVGGTSKLTQTEQKELVGHLENHVYLTAKEICSFVKKTFRVKYTPKGMTSLLHQLGFTYKKPKHLPGKADIDAQVSFIKNYRGLQESKKDEDRIYFMDGVHPMHNSQPAYGWIKKGKDMVLKANTGRQRLNLNGAYNTENHTVIIQEAEMINSQSTVSLLKEILRKQPLGMIYIILDNARYYRSEIVQDFVQKNKRIHLMFLPPYSPNLNIIERLWKFFKKKVTYNTYYPEFSVFREYCLNFFKKIKKHRHELETLMTDNFQLIRI